MSSESGGRWAVVLAGTDYPGTRDDLPKCGTDASNMRNMLVDVFGFSRSNVSMAVGNGRQLTKAIIGQKLQWMRDRARGNDLIVFYYAGHGGPGARQNRDDNETLVLPSSERYSETDLLGELRRFPNSTVKLVILDSCHSGGFLGLRSVPNTIVMTASSYDELSNDCSITSPSNWCPIDLPWGGVFTSWLVDTVRDGQRLGLDTNRNGRVGLGEAWDYAKRKSTVTNSRHPQMAASSGADHDILH